MFLTLQMPKTLRKATYGGFCLSKKGFCWEKFSSFYKSIMKDDMKVWKWGSEMCIFTGPPGW